jgi:hypothetical protein
VRCCKKGPYLENGDAARTFSEWPELDHVCVSQGIVTNVVAGRVCENEEDDRAEIINVNACPRHVCSATYMLAASFGLPESFPATLRSAEIVQET